jgi:pyruvate dehydrogenase E2 component (dihydrolipoamide acetyltransferase)
LQQLKELVLAEEFVKRIFWQLHQRSAAAPPAQVISTAPVASTSSSAAIAVSPLRGTSVTMTRLRKVIADRMVESLKISAQLTTVIEVDVTKIDRLRKAAKEKF